MEKQKLIEVLKAVKPGLANKEIIEQSSSFVFKDRHVVTYNDEVMISHPIDLDFEGVIKAEELYKLLNSVKDDDIKITRKGNELAIKGKKFQAGLAFDTNISLPIDEVPVGSSWKKLPKDFCDGIKFCLFSTGTDYSKPILTCIHIYKDVIESSDNFRITQYSMTDSVFKRLLLPLTAAKELVNYKPTKYQKTDNDWINFKNKDNVIFSCRTYKEKYPDISPFLKVKGHDIRFPTSLIQSLVSAEVLCEQDPTGDKFVWVDVDGDKIIIKSQSVKGWYQEGFKLKHKSKNKIRFEINSIFFRDILSHLKKAVIAKDKTKMKFIGENFVHVLSLRKQ